MSHICFVTEELYPITSGGAGALIYNSIRVLKQRGHQVSILLDVSEEAFERATEIVTAQTAEAPVDRLYCVSELTRDLPPYADQAFDAWYYWRSHRLFWALRKVVEQNEVDFVEFNDFYGPAYYALAAKASGVAFDRTRLGIRLHTPWEQLLVAGDGLAVAPYVLAIRAIERAALRLAEHVLSPSEEYTQSIYRPLYEPGLGDIHTSKPALLTWPRSAADEAGAKHIILFYGRLQPMKGLDRLLAACLELLQRIPAAEFWFVGADSMLARDSGTVSYSELLQRRIPEQLKPKFVFAGRLDFEALGRALPRVRFAVFPNYLESFCYAAHELYQAGVPVIMSDIAPFSGFFTHDENALTFDGSIADLVGQMERLYEDDELRARLTRPYPTNQEPLGQFYDALPATSWMAPPAQPPETCSVLVAVIDSGTGGLETTLGGLRAEVAAGDTIVVLKEIQAADTATPLLLLDRCYSIQAAEGHILAPAEAQTGDALLLLAAGDRLERGTLQRWRTILALHPQISFVGGWRAWRQTDGTAYIDCLPIEICLEQLLFMVRPLRQRVLMRTEPGQRLDDVFDFRLGPLGELGYLWQLDQQRGPGVSVPELSVSCGVERLVNPSQNFASIVAHMVARDSSPTRQRALALRSLQPEATTGKLAAELRSIKGTKAWRLVTNYWKVRSRLRAFRTNLSL